MDALVSVFLELVKISLTAGMIAGIILLIRAVIGKSSLAGCAMPFGEWC